MDLGNYIKYYMAERYKEYSPMVVDASRITLYMPNPKDNGNDPHTPDFTAFWTGSILMIIGAPMIYIKYRRLVWIRT